MTMKGLILAGGHSRRFGGTDKFLAAFPTLSGTVLEHLSGVLSQLSDIDGICVSCREDQRRLVKKILPHAEIFPDPEPKPVSAPLFGVASALKAVKSAVLVIPCDVPLMTSGVLGILAEMRAGSLRQKTTPPFLRFSFIHSDARVETLIGIYEYACLPFMDAAAANGKFGLYSAIPLHRQKLAPFPYGPAFYNMNSPSDYSRISSLMLNGKTS